MVVWVKGCALRVFRCSSEGGSGYAIGWSRSNRARDGRGEKRVYRTRREKERQIVDENGNAHRRMLEEE